MPSGQEVACCAGRVAGARGGPRSPAPGVGGGARALAAPPAPRPGAPHRGQRQPPAAKARLQGVGARCMHAHRVVSSCIDLLGVPARSLIGERLCGTVNLAASMRSDAVDLQCLALVYALQVLHVTSQSSMQYQGVKDPCREPVRQHNAGAASAGLCVATCICIDT